MRVTGVAVLAAVLLAAGCGGGSDDPPPLPPVTAPPTTSAIPTATVSAFPETPQGAAAFARFALEAIDRAYASRRTDELQRVFATTCGPCQNFVRAVTEVREKNLKVTGGTSRILSVEAPGGQGTQVEVSTRSDYAGITLTEPSGKVVLREEPGELQTTVTLRRSGYSWVVVNLENVE